jgi:hypothetical protein
VSMVVDVVLAAGGVVLGRWLARALRVRRAAESVVAADANRPVGSVLAGLPCALGDVIMRTVERDEAWLAGALVFHEEKPVAALFVAPEAGVDRAVFARQGDDGLIWLAALARGELALTNDPPHAVEHGGVRFERVRRLPVRVTREGNGAPEVGGRAVIAEYVASGAERLVVVAGAEQTCAWIGIALTKADYDVLPGGKGS